MVVKECSSRENRVCKGPGAGRGPPLHRSKGVVCGWSTVGGEGGNRDRKLKR